MKRNVYVEVVVESNLINAGVAANIALFIGYIQSELLHCQSKRDRTFYKRHVKRLEVRKMKVS